MNLVECEMCGELYWVDKLKEGFMFVCVVCVKILSKINCYEIHKGIKLSYAMKSEIFTKFRNDTNMINDIKKELQHNKNN